MEACGLPEQVENHLYGRALSRSSQPLPSELCASLLVFENSALDGVVQLSSLAIQCLTGSFEGVDERLLRELFDDWFNGPSLPKWHVSRQRDGSAFDDYACADIPCIPLLESPIGIQAP